MAETSVRAGEVTRILADLRSGDAGAYERLVPLVYEELRSIAGALMRDQAPGHTLQPTAVVHEALLRLVGEGKPDWHHRRQFLAVAAGCMRRVLVDHARKRDAGKRGGDWTRVSLSVASDARSSTDVDVLALHQALESLASIDEQQAKVVELRYFGGLTIEETAEHLGIGTTAVKDDWAMARPWLFRELTKGSGQA